MAPIHGKQERPANKDELIVLTERVAVFCEQHQDPKIIEALAPTANALRTIIQNVREMALDIVGLYNQTFKVPPEAFRGLQPSIRIARDIFELLFEKDGYFNATTAAEQRARGNRGRSAPPKRGRPAGGGTHVTHESPRGWG